MRSKEAVLAEIRELKSVQKGLPKSTYRIKIDKRLHELFCKLAQLEKENPTALSKKLFNNKNLKSNASK